jgi:hypothetical protein
VCNTSVSLRLSPEMLANLKEIARWESARHGEYVSRAKVVRESAARTIRRKLNRPEGGVAAGDRPHAAVGPGG